jgi:hypothetical protein
LIIRLIRYKTFVLTLAGALILLNGRAQHLITEKGGTGAFPIVAGSTATSLYVDEGDHAVVQKVTELLQQDILAVTGRKPALVYSAPAAKQVIIIGTLGKSALVDGLVAQKKLKADRIQGKWEAYQIAVVNNPLPNVEQALVIAGSDRRGTAYGVLELSKQMGVSPWYWWADVPVKKKATLYYSGNTYWDAPKVKYRGIFINDEAPALSGWSREKFGGFNHKFYEKVFELILRMKGDYLWPAMWGSAFNDDDTLNPVVADQYAIVMGTSHHEPLVRAHDEWRRYGEGKWNYDSNEVALRSFWKRGIERMSTRENIVTIGMRGDGDEPMTEGTAIALLERIVKDQRGIIQEVTQRPASETPQLWALYKEVQDYYDKGMRVPDDVTLLLCDDNWGNIRRLPKPTDKPHPGGYGIYYHFDYVGGPRNYKWINTNQIPRIWEQMHLAWEYGADRIWIVNVGDIKPMELPTQFFLDYAWDPEAMPVDKMAQYTTEWAKREFGLKHATAIAGIVDEYTRYNSRRKPELLSPDTYSLVNYREWERVVEDYKSLLEKAEKINKELPAAYGDAFYQQVLHPVQASTNLYELYYTVAKNRLYAQQGRTTTNMLAQKAKTLFDKDSLIGLYYNKELAGGKWSHMMDQTHIGYTYWQQPHFNAMPEVKSITILAEAVMGVAVEGSTIEVSGSGVTLPVFNSLSKQKHYLEVYNKGTKSFAYTINAAAPWIMLSSTKGVVEDEQRIWIDIDWSKAPKGDHSAPITIIGHEGKRVTVTAKIENPGIDRNNVKGFVERDGIIAIEAAHYSKSVAATPLKWQEVPGLGRTLSGVTLFPVTTQLGSLSSSSPHLQYQIHLQDTGSIKVHTLLSPTLNFHHTKGLRFAVSIDDEAPQIINMHEGENNRMWEQWVANNINNKVSHHRITKPGTHTLKFWAIDPGVVLQRLVIDAGGLKQSYLGPIESTKY